MASSRKKAKNTLPVIVILVVVAVLLLIAVLTENRPNELQVDLAGFFASENGSLAVIRDDVLTHEDFLYDDGNVYTSVSYLQEKLNKRFFFDEKETLLLYTLPNGTVEASPATEFEGHAVLRENDGKWYVLLSYAAQFTAMEWTLYEEPARLVLKTVYGESGEVQAVTRATVRSGPGVTHPIMTFLELGDRVRYLEEQAEWDYICTEDGIPGYVSKKEVSQPIIVNSKSSFEEPVYRTVQEEETICMVWQQIRYKSDNDELENLTAGVTGLDIISPTWLFLKNGEGEFDSSADPSYVERAHAMGLKVWILLNNMDHEIYGEVLCSNFDVTTYRRRLIQGIMQTLAECGADGINVDIESLPAAGGPGFLQFIRELSIACHKAGKILSVDNYVPSAWTAHYDRREQAVFADYLIIMGYDEHYIGSDAGSTASLPFVIKGTEDTLAQVPAKQIIQGVPLFTRLWKSSGSSLSSTALGMNEIPALLEKYELRPSWDADLGQYFAAFEMDGENARIWIEDQESMALRLESLVSYGLGGIAAWRLGMESEDVWAVFEHFMNTNQVK